MNIVSATITGSLILNGVNISSVTGSESSINALNSFTASAATTGSNQFNGNQTVTGSVNITGSLIVTGSIIGTVTTASYVLNAVSASYALNATTSSYALVSTSASYAANSDLLDGRDSLTFANTGSNSFVGTQNINGAVAITGSLTTTGAITAQTLNVQQVTSSIVYSSGSNIFGNSISDTQSMTGSVGISGSLAVTGASTITGVLTLNSTITNGTYTYSLPSATGILALTSDIHSAVTLSAIGATANANGATLTGQVLNLQPADASFGGIVTTGTQTFAGAKTLTSALVGTTFTGTGLVINNNGEALRAYGTSPNVSFYNAANTTRGGYVNHDGTNINIVANVGVIALGSAISGTSATFNTTTISGAVTTAINSQPVTTTHYINHRLGNGYILGRGTTGETFISSNTDLFTATITAASSYLSQNAGNLYFFNAPSVTAGSTPTFTQQFTIAASGAATFSSSVTAKSLAIIDNVNTDLYNYINNQSTGTSATARFDIGVNVGSYAITMIKYGLNYIGTLFGNSVTNSSAIFDNSASSNGFSIGLTTTAPLIFGTSNTERMRITSGGNVGIGTTSPQSKFVTSNGGAIGFEIDPTVSASVARTLIYNRSTSAYGNIENWALSHQFHVNGGTLALTLASTGQVTQSTTISDWSYVMSNSNATSPNGIIIQYTAANKNNTSNQFLYCVDNSGATLRMEIRSNGGIANYSANDVNLSDERVKKDIEPLESYWDKFKAIEIVKFKYKDQTHDDFNIGVIAQQVEAVSPEFVDVDGWDNKPKLDEEGNEIINDEEPLKSIYTADLYHATIKVLQECMSKIESQQSQIEELKLLIK